MLDVIRKHSQAWLIKLIFAIIILVFIFFFGYSQMREGGRGGINGQGGIAARVNNDTISMSQYSLALDEATKFYSQVFKDKIPPEMQSQIRSSALYKIINQTLLTQFALELGITVTPVELYDIISSNPSFQDNGVFDPIAYKTNFLPFFERKYGFNFEWMLKNDLLAQKVADFLTGHVSVSEAAAKDQYTRDNTLWDFERIKVSIPKEKITDTRSVKDIAQSIVDAYDSKAKKDVDKILKEFGLTKENVNGVSVKDTRRLIPENPESPAIKDLLALTTDKPLLGNPVEQGETFYVFKLVKLQKTTDENWNKEKENFVKTMTERERQNYLQEWQGKMRNDAKIEEYVLSEK